MVIPVESHFVDRPRARALFDAYVAALELHGPITVSVSKTRIELMTRARFTAVMVRRDYLKVTLWLKRQAASERFTKVEHLGGHDWLHHFEIRDESDLDADLVVLLAEARSVGDQNPRAADS